MKQRFIRVGDEISDDTTLVSRGGLLRGLRLGATGRNPHHFDVGFDDLEAGVGALLLCERSVVGNPYHEGE